MARKMLADELGDMLNPAPRHEIDPDAVFGDEAAFLNESDDELQRHTDDAAQRPSQLRLRAGLEQPGAEYRGRVSSRAALFGDDDGGDGEDDDDDDGDDGDDDDDGEGGLKRMANGFGRSSSGVDEDEEGEEEGEEGEEGGSGGEEGSSGEDDEGSSGGDEGSSGGDEGSSGGDEGSSGGDEGSSEGDEGSSGEGKEAEDDDEVLRGDMVSQLQRYQADDEMDELERQHVALREQAAMVAAARHQRDPREVTKAASVRAQKAIWERALEARILLQRPLAASARLARPGAQQAAVAASGAARQEYAALMGSCREALDQLMELHGALIDRHPQAAAAAAAARQQDAAGAAAAAPRAGGKRGRAAAGLDGAAKGEADRAWARVEAAVRAAAPFRDGSLDKWHRRTVLSSGTAALRGGGGLRALQQSVTVQVASLMRDAPRLVSRTRLTTALAPRLLCSPPGGEGRQEGQGREDGGEEQQGGQLEAERHQPPAADRDPETFDDGEFYQQLLKELIEAGGAAGGATGGALLQRPPKRRKAVDRRASKGRKLRYHVMDKLVGFCAPVELAPPPFAAQLFGNLFGGGSAAAG